MGMNDFFQDSLYSLDYTFHNSKLSCWRPAYYMHISFAYLTVFAGFLAFLSRLSSNARIKSWHVWFGRFYLVGMIWAAGTAIVIHNTGSPLGVLISFFLVLFGLTLGYVLITIHQRRRLEELIKQARLGAGSAGSFGTISPSTSDGELIGGPSNLNALSVGNTLDKPNTWWKLIKERMFTLKAAHGCLMTVSWINLAGRIFATPNLAHFDCYTYSAYKPAQNRFYTPPSILNGSVRGGIELLNYTSPAYTKQPWANMEELWAVYMSIGIYLGAFIIGVAYLSFERIFGERKSRRPRG